MITGHYGVTAFVVGMTRTHLGTRMFAALLAASVVPDGVDVVLAIAGICSPYGLYSHTLNAVVLEVAVVAGVVWLVTRSPSLTLLFSVAILLHRPADYFTGRKLFVAGGEIYGLNLYQKPLHDLALEAGVVLVGWWSLRRRVGAPAPAVSRSMLWCLLLVQTAAALYGLGPWRPLKPSGCVDAAPLQPLAHLVEPLHATHVTHEEIVPILQVHDSTNDSRRRPARGLRTAGGHHERDTRARDQR